jgi:hypothetical protein
VKAKRFRLPLTCLLGLVSGCVLGILWGVTAHSISDATIRSWTDGILERVLHRALIFLPVWGGALVLVFRPVRGAYAVSFLAGHLPALAFGAWFGSRLLGDG